MVNCRCRIVRVTAAAVSILPPFRPGFEVDPVACDACSLPAGSVVLGFQHFVATDTYHIRVAHPTWTEVFEGCDAPFHNSQYQPVVSDHARKAVDKAADPKPHYRGREFI